MIDKKQMCLFNSFTAVTLLHLWRSSAACYNSSNILLYMCISTFCLTWCGMYANVKGGLSLSLSYHLSICPSIHPSVRTTIPSSILLYYYYFHYWIYLFIWVYVWSSNWCRAKFPAAVALQMLSWVENRFTILCFLLLLPSSWGMTQSLLLY